jgi:hypothetical protein
VTGSARISPSRDSCSATVPTLDPCSTTIVFGSVDGPAPAQSDQ